VRVEDAEMLAAAGSIWAGLGLVLVVACGAGVKEGVTGLGRLEVKGGCWASYLRLGHLSTYTSTPVHTRIYMAQEHACRQLVQPAGCPCGQEIGTSWPSMLVAGHLGTYIHVYT
jgi:hypothetical protein